MQIYLANPRGFCAGVDRAIAIVNQALTRFEPPIYVRHEVVHNKFVVSDLANRGAVFVEELHEVPDGSIVIFSAHGVSKAVEDEAKRRDLTVFDATCPLVTKVHIEVAKFAQDGMDAVLIGHAGHPEVEGTMGRFNRGYGGQIHLVENESDVRKLMVQDADRLAFVTQTTLSMDDTARVIDALRDKFPNIQGPRKDDICYATQNRQDAVKDLASRCEVVLVVGSPNSSNSNRLRELAERMGCQAYLIDNANEIKSDWFDGIKKVGVTAGASAPEVLIQEVLQQLQDWGGELPHELAGIEENVIFSLPKALRIPVTEVGK
ncbi:4-hydroxy-3-methylbut-2-enyl diphosphate reductase [Psychrobacter sp. TAE2020]|uniref:4-hydroxy-3-methylbut-2-enyl diphosphate reductase n=1 Tax=Psychrobacter sp. TAE2020 TaxID=2846762 RepID=UPI001C0F7797|nr:4-hydroxy-3-methylbut-2-enyl diphosphate reductase [Psychrobacter sp. TAE2020]MBU5617635.1 4-hydroxy-3-methylbut-2-enyl diphosphate reductase [Psychrobacter sp. TAE2020]